MKKIACLFPGIGYTCDKPLLYYSWKLLKGLGWEVVPVPYTGFPADVKGHPEKMRQAAQTALEQAEEILRETGVPREQWKDAVDMIAAEIILQDEINSRAGEETAGVPERM